MELRHDSEVLGNLASRRDAEAVRESIRGKEFRYGIVSNALDYALSGDERDLVYLSPRDRRRAEELAKQIREAIEG